MVGVNKQNFSVMFALGKLLWSTPQRYFYWYHDCIKTRVHDPICGAVIRGRHTYTDTYTQTTTATSLHILTILDKGGNTYASGTCVIPNTDHLGRFTVWKWTEVALHDDKLSRELIREKKRRKKNSPAWETIRDTNKLLGGRALSNTSMNYWLGVTFNTNIGSGEDTLPRLSYKTTFSSNLW